MININDIISHWRINKSIPRFIILNNFSKGEKDSFVYNLTSNVYFDFYEYTSSITDIRKIIELVYIAPHAPTIFYIDCENISNISQNALLKVVEEPPNNVYILLSCNCELLPTLLSRSVLLKSDVNTDINSEAYELACNVVSDIYNKSGIELYKDCNKLKAKETEENKIDCVEAYTEIKKRLFDIDCKLDNIIDSINETNKIMNGTNTNKKMALEVFLNDILNEVKNNG